MYDDAIDTIEHNGYVIHVVVDDSPENPRDFMGADSTILCREHNRYELGDEQSDAGSPEEMQAYEEDCPEVRHALSDLR